MKPRISNARARSALALGFSLLTCGGAQAASLLALTDSNSLLRFDSTAPGTIQSTVAITGLQAGENVLGIDIRPATGQLLALGSSSRLYVVDPGSGAATAVGNAGAFTLNGTVFGVDFNPVPDRLRVVSDADQNLRLNPNDGSLTSNDTPLAFAGGDANAAQNPTVVASAYLNNFAGTTATTLYGIDANLDVLVTQNPPNNGTLNTIGTLGVDASNAAGFDIASDGTAYAALNVAGVSGLYTINLATGAASAVGPIGGGTGVRGLAVLGGGTESLFALTSGNSLLRFTSNTPGTIASTTAVSGLASGESLLGIDFRPATGELYALGSTSTVYVLNPLTGAATAVGGGAFTPSLAGTDFGFDFNPTVDRIRVVSDTDQNLRLNPSTGVVAATDTNLAFAGGDPNAGTNPNVTGSAYTNNFAGATSTRLFGIDATIDALVLQNPPNNGTLSTIGALGVDATSALGFDISSATGTPYALLTVGGVANLYGINLNTGAATLVGSVGGGTPVRGLAIGIAGGTLQFSAPTYSVSEAGASATVTVTRSGGMLGAVSVDFATSDGSAVATGDYTAVSGTLTFAEGETSKTFSIPVTPDNAVEADETVNVTLTAPAGGASLGAQASAVVTIVNGDNGGGGGGGGCAIGRDARVDPILPIGLFGALLALLWRRRMAPTRSSIAPGHARRPKGGRVFPPARLRSHSTVHRQSLVVISHPTQASTRITS